MKAVPENTIVYEILGIIFGATKDLLNISNEAEKNVLLVLRMKCTGNGFRT